MKMHRFHFLFFLLVVLNGQIKAKPSNTLYLSDLPDEDTSLNQSYENFDVDLSFIILDEDETDEFKSSTRSFQFNEVLTQNCLQPEQDLSIKAHKDLNWLDFTDLPPPVL